MDLIYHYTSFDIFKRLLKQQAILPDRSEPQNEKEIPTVTFSKNQEWEATRYRVGRFPNGQIIMMNRPLLERFCGGLVRIGVKPELAPMDWHDMKDRVGLSKGAINGIYDFAIRVGARTSHWYGTFDQIPEAQWIVVQLFKEGQWQDIQDDEIPNVDDIDLSQPVGIFEIRFDNTPEVDVPSLHEVFDDSSVETTPMDGKTHRESTV